MLCCRGRGRTSTEQLDSEPDPGPGFPRPGPVTKLYPVTSTPETGGLVCQFQHPTMLLFQLKLRSSISVSCRGRVRTSTEQLGRQKGWTLSRYLHPRDRRACLPVSTPYNVLELLDFTILVALVVKSLTK